MPSIPVTSNSFDYVSLFMSEALWYFQDLFHNEYACKSFPQTICFFVYISPQTFCLFYVDCPLSIHWIFVCDFSVAAVAAAPMSKFWTVCHFNWISMQSQTSHIKSSVVCSCDLWQTVRAKAKAKEPDLLHKFSYGKMFNSAHMAASVCVCVANAKHASLPDAATPTRLQFDTIVKRVHCEEIFTSKE